MKFLQSLSAQVSLFTQGAILALGVVFILLDAITESLNPVIDLAWVTVLVCGLPLLINSVQSIWERLEIHANFLIVVAMVALISNGDYHTAAYVGLIVQAGFFLEQLITGESHYTVDDDMLPTMPAQLVAMRQLFICHCCGCIAIIYGLLCIDTGFYTYCNLVISTMPMFFGAYLSGTYDGIPCG